MKKKTTKGIYAQLERIYLLYFAGFGSRHLVERAEGYLFRNNIKLQY